MNFSYQRAKYKKVSGWKVTVQTAHPILETSKVVRKRNPYHQSRTMS